MASEIRVNKINSRTGVGTITLSPTGVDFTGIATVATLKATTGIVTTLTATTGIVTTLTVDTARTTTGIVTTLTADTSRITTGIVTTLTADTSRITTGIVTTLTADTAKVGAAVTISESGMEVTDTDISGEDADVQAICNAAWTDAVKESYRIKLVNDAIAAGIATA